MGGVTRVDPSIWRTVRAEWEDNPKMTLTEVATRLGVSNTAVSKHAKKEGWAKVVVTDIDRVVYSPRQLAEIAVRALVRACTQTQDPAASVKAAQTLLDRTMGRVVAEQMQPLIQPDLEAEAEKWPDWLKERRLAYQEGRLSSDDGFEALPDASPDAQALETPPDPAPPTCPPAQSLPEPPARLHLVEPPTFYDGPGRPAVGPYRGS